MDFKLHSDFKPTGDQPQAIKELVDGFNAGNQFETLLGVTGSGKTFTMANVIAALNKPTIVIAHNKTLAAQLYGEFKEFFPENAVEYFVSYYDYYQPEAYIPSTDKFIEKDSAINDEIDRLRHSATAALSERRDVIIVASVSCIYGIASREDYEMMTLSLRPGQSPGWEPVIRRLVEMQYVRDEMDFHRGTFRVKGDCVDIYPIYSRDVAVRLEFFGDEVDRISEFDPLSGKLTATLDHLMLFPASHYVVPEDRMKQALINIEKELEERIAYFKANDKLIEAQRIEERTRFDMEMLRETGICSGIENYSMHLAGLTPGCTPHTLLEHFGDDYLMIVDESHMSIPQFRGMYNGDRARKTILVDYGFRLPSALENRPLHFEEFENMLDRVLFVSATPGPYESDHELLRAEQVIRPTGLLDPKVEVRPSLGQVDDLAGEINAVTSKHGKVLVTTLTKRMAEELTEYFRGIGIRVRYLHSDIDTLERSQIIRDMRLDVFDVLVGINLLREGLDIPEVSLVAIIDADKEGFLRSETSLIQTVGRAARNVDGHVIMYADTVTGSMERAIGETNRRRAIQSKYNEDNNITPKSIEKKVRELISISKKIEDSDRKAQTIAKDPESMTLKELESEAERLRKLMNKAAAELEFEKAAELRDRMVVIRKHIAEVAL
ncbi:MAG: excinuclease ABC subunit UvrB [Lachnospiraceae bacterium]|nr:excinuclease ABC subunit UvrB [Lachnospiraceae bacterium]